MQPDSSARRVRRPATSSKAPPSATSTGNVATTPHEWVTGATENDLAERVKTHDSAMRQSEARIELVIHATGALVYEVDMASGHVDVAGDTQQIVG
jgi:hypothetical protein